MGGNGRNTRELTHEFFRIYPDYSFCQTLAENIQAQVTSYSQALNHLALKVRAADAHKLEIEEKLNQRTVLIGGERVPIRTLSLRRIMDQEDETLAEVTRFYFKHPFAHGRTWRSRLLPGWLRTFFLRALLGHAKRRGLDLDYSAYFDILTLL